MRITKNFLFTKQKFTDTLAIESIVINLKAIIAIKVINHRTLGRTLAIETRSGSYLIDEPIEDFEINIFKELTKE